MKKEMLLLAILEFFVKKITNKSLGFSDELDNEPETFLHSEAKTVFVDI